MSTSVLSTIKSSEYSTLNVIDQPVGIMQRHFQMSTPVLGGTLHGVSSLKAGFSKTASIDVNGILVRL